jgi:hypothetical protein
MISSRSTTSFLTSYSFLFIDLNLYTVFLFLTKKASANDAVLIIDFLIA